jgi:dipeptidyl-peptidase-4
MKKYFVMLMLLPMTLGAQTLLDVRPAHEDGKVLTMEDANTNAAVFPARLSEMPAEFKRAARPELLAVPKGGSLYYRPAADEDAPLIPVALSDDPQISYGTSVSRNEFGITGGTFWSPSQRKLAFYRKDEHLVTEFPLLDISTRTGSLRAIKYPMNGMDSERIALGIYDLASGKTVWAQVTDFGEDRYLTNISWAPDEKYVFIQVLDRSQHHMKLNMYRADNGAFVRTVLTEDNDAWVEPEDPIRFIQGTYEFIYRTDNRDGYRNLYRCDTLGTVRRLTAVDADVQYLANDGRYLYYTSAEVSPVENHLFRLDLKKRKAVPVRLTPERGWHTVSLSADFSCFVDAYSSFNVPRVCNLRATDGKLIRELMRADDPLAEYATGRVEFGTVPSADGKFDNYYRMYYPVGFDPAKKYPVILYVYGGPHSQMVQDTWIGNIRMWEMYMAERGYIVYVQDNRGTPNRGAAYEKAINRACGQAEMADQMVGVNRLRSLPYVDADRIGVHGWSYGGFMTISLATTYPDVFKVAVAGGPVIDWKWYEVMYGERYMDNPETNPAGFALTGLVDKAPKLKAKLLICQGAVDNTVVWQNSLSFIQECISNNIPVDYFPYPKAEHNMRGIERVHLYQKITDYFNDYL